MEVTESGEEEGNGLSAGRLAHCMDILVCINMKMCKSLFARTGVGQFVYKNTTGALLANNNLTEMTHFWGLSCG